MSEDPTETVSLGLSSQASSSLLERGTVVDRYVVLDLLGSGGMGVVYTAYDPELDRKVALKLLRSDRAGEAARQQLLREAQAAARLSHPNVVSIHDAGTHGDQVFLAMELVDGRNLRQWLQERGRSRREVLAALIDAGRGLAAAHAAGLVHRDVKPENVLIGDGLMGGEGRARMADFGIARSAGGAEEDGFAAGTPAYMAPEQRRGDSVDARSDQYAFCVTAWEALLGERPPGGDARRLPFWLHQALLRGLSDDPAGRHSSLEALLAVLAHDPAVSRRRWLAAAAVILATGASLIAWERGRASRVRTCRAEAGLAGIWDEARKREIQASFVAAREMQASAAWLDAERTLDRYTGQWAAMYREACEATWLRGEQSEELLDRRMVCLERRKRDLGALTAVLARADAQVVRQAGKAARSLTELRGCADKEALLRRVPPPRDLAVRARLAEAEDQLSEGTALFRAGRYEPASAKSSLVARQADTLAFAPLQAEAWLLHGNIQEARGEYSQAESAFYRALWAADHGADDAQRALIGKKLAYVVGYRQGRTEEGFRLLQNARAALVRAGSPPLVEAEILNVESSLLVIEQRYREAIPLFQRAVTLIERENPEDPQLYLYYANLGEMLVPLGEAKSSETYQRRALNLARRQFPDDHPRIAALRFNLANSLMEQRRLDEARRLLEQALASREKGLSPDHLDVAETLSTLGMVWTELGRPGQALPLLERAVTIYDEKTPSGYPYRELARYNLGWALAELGRTLEAETLQRQTLAALEASPDTPNPLLSMPLLALGELYLDQGRPAVAIPLLERAVASLDSSSTYPRQYADAVSLLARARREIQGER